MAFNNIKKKVKILVEIKIIKKDCLIFWVK